jgi:hypothetical protein
MTTLTQEVVFSTSAAVPLQRKKTTPISSSGRSVDTPRVVAASMRRIFLGPRDAARPARKNKPERYSYLERSLMAREMYRL